MEDTLKKKGELEIDTERGVVYFHSDTGVTVLRICGLKFPKDFGRGLFDSMDVTLKCLKEHPVIYNLG